MRVKATIRHLLLVAISVFWLAGCGNTASSSGGSPSDPWGLVEIEGAEPVQIALAVSESDTVLGREGREQRRGAELAVSDYSQINGYPIELVPFDTSCSSGGGQAAANLILPNQSIVAVVGPSCSAACIETTPLFDGSRLSAVSGSCGPDSLTQPGSHRDSFLRTIYPDGAEGGLAAQFAYSELGRRRAALIVYETGDTDAFADAFRARMIALGGEIAGETLVTLNQQTDYLVAMRAILSVRPDVIYAPLFPADAVDFVQFKRNTPLNDIPVIGNRFFWSTWFADEVGGAITNVYASGPNLRGVQYENLVNKYEQTYSEVPTSAAFAYTYDATVMLLQAIEQAAVTSNAGNLIVGRKALHDALDATTGYQGATGVLTCTSWGDCSTTSLAIGVLEDGKWQPVFVP